MANKNKHNTGTGTQKRKPAARHHAPVPKGGSKKPLLYLIGFGGLAVGATIWLWPSEPTVDVERTRYASREACLQDWNDPADCEYVADANGASSADAASGASGSAYADAASGASAASGAVYADAASAASAASGTSSGGSSGAASTTERGWYGPYYARDGMVYHANGLSTIGVPPQHGRVSSLTVRESALSEGSSVFRSTPHSVSVNEGRAISRGGFMSFHGGSGEGGGHGGGEGGGHGGGGGHGSGGG